MTYMLRDRPDGQVEIVMMAPVTIGVFPKRDVGRHVCDLLNEARGEKVPPVVAQTFEDPVAALVLWGDAAAEALRQAGEAVAAALVIEDVALGTTDTPSATPPGRQEPQAPVHMRPDAAKLTEAQREAAFNRLTAGETLAAVALEFGLTMGQLRGMWAQHKRQMQKFYSSGGQDSCKLCGRAFTPSASNPDTCARCSHEG